MQPSLTTTSIDDIIIWEDGKGELYTRPTFTRDATFDVITSDLMFSEIFFNFDGYATNLLLKTIFIL